MTLGTFPSLSLSLSFFMLGWRAESRAEYLPHAVFVKIINEMLLKYLARGWLMAHKYRWLLLSAQHNAFHISKPSINVFWLVELSPDFEDLKSKLGATVHSPPSYVSSPTP